MFAPGDQHAHSVGKTTHGASLPASHAPVRQGTCNCFNDGNHRRCRIAARDSESKLPAYETNAAETRAAPMAESADSSKSTKRAFHRPPSPVSDAINRLAQSRRWASSVARASASCWAAVALLNADVIASSSA